MSYARYGPWAVVAGGSEGVGAEFARLLAESGVNLVLQRQSGHGWDELRKVKTDAKGRVSDLYIPGEALQAGTYRLIFETGEYFKTQGVPTFFPRVEVVFAIEKTDEHYHIPLLISPHGYSTYRGS